MNLEVTQFQVEGKCPIPVSGGLNILFNESGFLLVINEFELSQDEIKAFQQGEMEIGFTVVKDIIFFIITIPNFLQPSDIAFTARISPLKKEDIITPEKGCGYAFNMVLVERLTNEIKGLRTVALSWEMSNMLTKSMKEQFEVPFDKEQYGKDVSMIQSMYNSYQLENNTIANTKYKGGK